VSGAATTAGPEGLSFDPSAVASLAPMLVEATADVRAPSGKSLHDAWLATWMRDHKAAAAPSMSAMVETRIGSGSDHTVFLNHLGRPVINLGFTGDYGVYHSGYDDHYWMAHIGDPAFEYHTAVSRIWGLMALRLANADILPFDFEFNAASLQQFLAEFETHAKIDPALLPLQPLHAHLADFGVAGRELREATLKDLATAAASATQIQRLNDQLLQVESNWLDPAGIPGRPWFKHLLYAARYTYAHLEYPGLTEAAEAADWKGAAEQAKTLDAAIVRNTQFLRDAEAAWKASSISELQDTKGARP
jgi:N-acetylated-alpha-linked acidic dipeptidase